MPEIGPMEILVCAVVALIVFGPEKLPDMARNVGRFLNDLRRVSTEMRSEVQGAFNPDPEDDGFKPEEESETAASKADQLEKQGPPEDKAGGDEAKAPAGETPSPTDYPTRRPKTTKSEDA